MNEQDKKAKGPGQPGRGNREGFGGRGDRGYRPGRGRDRREGGAGGGGAAYRVVTELSTLEKALTKNDLSAMKAPLNEVLRAIRQLHLKSLQDVDLNTRGRMITSLMRVQRMAAPKAAAAAPSESTDLPSTEAIAASPETSSPESASPEATSETPVEPAPPAESSAAPASVNESKPAVSAEFSYADVQYTVGLIWHFAQEADRATSAFENAGRKPSDADLAALPAPAVAASSARTHDAKGDRSNRRDRPARGERGERSPRPERRDRSAPFQPTGDWQVDAKKLEEIGRTRDAARLYEKNKSFADGLRLFEAGGDVKSAVKMALLGKIDDAYAALSPKLKPDELATVLEQAQAWEKLMEVYVARQDFDSIARLYERARQFDQAGLAWERAGKLAQARKAYERAHDFAAANRLRELEVRKLVERGDRLGAATLLMTVGRKSEAVEMLKELPGPKAFHFMNKLKLAEDASAFAKEELAKAEAQGNQLQRGRWLELLGQHSQAIEIYRAADRKDKMALVYEQMGDFKTAAELMEASGHLDRSAKLFQRAGDVENASRVNALPRPLIAKEDPSSDMAGMAEAAPVETQINAQA